MIERSPDYRDNTITPDGKFLGAITVTKNPASEDMKKSSVVLSALNWKNGFKIKLVVNNVRIVDMAIGSKSALLILVNKSGRRELVAPSLQK